MIQRFFNAIDIHTRIVHSDIHIWYSPISAIISKLIISGNYHNCGPMVNEILKKESFGFPCFTHDEIATVNGFKAVKKQKEWMAGRYLLKQMLTTCFFENKRLDTITFSYQDEGAPMVNDHTGVEISLSHSNDYTVAAASQTPGRIFGIDIEKVSKKPDTAFLKTAFTDKEIEAMPDQAEEIFRCWTIKEAYLKYIKKGFHESLKKVEIISDNIFHHGRKQDLNVQTFTIEPDYIFSLVSNKKPTGYQQRINP